MTKDQEKEIPLEKRLVFLFDVDGLLMDTPHEEAWRLAAVEKGIIPETYNFTPFYAREVAGKPGELGARRILSELPSAEGSYFTTHHTPESEKESIAAEFRGVTKKRHLDRLMAPGLMQGCNPFDDIATIVLESKKRGITVCAVSSSESAKKVLNEVDYRYLAHHTGNLYWDMLDGKNNYLGMFDAAALGAKTCWHNIGVEKLLHYSFARGVATEAYWRKQGNRNVMPNVVVFEDAREGISAIAPYDFITIGIARANAKGDFLTTKQQFMDNKAHLAYTEPELKAMPYDQLLADIAKFAK